MGFDPILETEVIFTTHSSGTRYVRTTTLLEALEFYFVYIDCGTGYVESIIGEDGTVWYGDE